MYHSTIPFEAGRGAREANHKIFITDMGYKARSYTVFKVLCLTLYGLESSEPTINVLENSDSDIICAPKFGA